MKKDQFSFYYYTPGTFSSRSGAPSLHPPPWCCRPSPHICCPPRGSAAWRARTPPVQIQDSDHVKTNKICCNYHLVHGCETDRHSPRFLQRRDVATPARALAGQTPLGVLNGDGALLLGVKHGEVIKTVPQVILNIVHDPGFLQSIAHLAGNCGSQCRNLLSGRTEGGDLRGLVQGKREAGRMQGSRRETIGRHRGGSVHVRLPGDSPHGVEVRGRWKQVGKKTWDGQHQS